MSLWPLEPTLLGGLLAAGAGILAAEWQFWRAGRAARKDFVERADKLRSVLFNEVLMQLAILTTLVRFRNDAGDLVGPYVNAHPDQYLREDLNNLRSGVDTAHNLLTIDEIGSFTPIRGLNHEMFRKQRAYDEGGSLPNYVEAICDLAAWLFIICWALRQYGEIETHEDNIREFHRVANWLQDAKSCQSDLDFQEDVNAALDDVLVADRSAEVIAPNQMPNEKVLPRIVPWLLITGLGFAAGMIMAATSAYGMTNVKRDGLTAINGPARVIDGDTIEVAGTRFRLKGVDAPERHTRDGLRAKVAMFDIVDGHTITCIDSGKKSHDRIVGHCYVHYDNPRYKQDIGEALIRQGWAQEAVGYTDRDTSARYAAAESEAVRQKLGLWAAPLAPTAKHWYSDPAIITILGSILSIVAVLAAAGISARENARANTTESRRLRREDEEKRRELLTDVLSTELVSCLSELASNLKMTGNIGTNYTLSGGGTVTVGRFQKERLRNAREIFNRHLNDLSLLSSDVRTPVMRAFSELGAILAEAEEDSTQEIFAIFGAAYFGVLAILRLGYKHNDLPPAFYGLVGTLLLFFSGQAITSKMHARNCIKIIDFFRPPEGWENVKATTGWEDGFVFFGTPVIPTTDHPPFTPKFEYSIYEYGIKLVEGQPIDFSWAK